MNKKRAPRGPFFMIGWAGPYGDLSRFAKTMASLGQGKGDEHVASGGRWFYHLEEIEVATNHD